MPAEPDAALVAPPTVFRGSFAATPGAVRSCLKDVVGVLADLSVDAEGRAVVELVLAEALNNVVEHAYRDRQDGMIRLTMDGCVGGLACLIEDDGLQMSGDAHGATAVGAPVIDRADPAEGGYGRHLMAQLTRDLRHERRGGRNRLSFVIPAV